MRSCPPNRLLQMVGKKYLGLQRKLAEESPMSSLGSPRSSISSPHSPSTPERGDLDVAVLLSDLDVLSILFTRLFFFIEVVPSSSICPLLSSLLIQDQSHIVIYGDLIMLILEIINAILTKNLAGNPNLIYSLLHEQTFFAHFRAPPKFSALVENIETVVVHFKARIAEANLDGGYEEMLRHIEKESHKWPRSKLRVTHQQFFSLLCSCTGNSQTFPFLFFHCSLGTP